MERLWIIISLYQLPGFISKEKTKIIHLNCFYHWREPILDIRHPVQIVQSKMHSASNPSSNHKNIRRQPLTYPRARTQPVRRFAPVNNSSICTLRSPMGLVPAPTGCELGFSTIYFKTTKLINPLVNRERFIFSPQWSSSKGRIHSSVHISFRDNVFS